MANRKGEQGEPTYTITSDEMEGKQNPRPGGGGLKIDKKRIQCGSWPGPARMRGRGVRAGRWPPSGGVQTRITVTVLP